MGRSYTPKYRIEYTTVITTDADGDWTKRRFSPSFWNGKRDGKPTVANLQANLVVFEASFAPGGCNDHVYAGDTVQLLAARLVRQADGAVVAEYSNDKTLQELSAATTHVCIEVTNATV